MITKGTTPLAFSNTGIKFIKIDSLNGTSIDNSKVGYISDEIHFGVLKRSILKENDILLAIAGATVGKHAIVKLENLPANTNQALAIIRLNGPILPTYLLSIFDTDLIPNYVRNICTASAQPNLNLVQVGNLYFGYPEMHEQEKINNFIEKIDSRIETQNKIISALESQKNALSQHYFKQSNIKGKDGYVPIPLNKILIERKTYAQKDDTYPHVTLSKEGIYDKGERYNRDFLVKDENKEYKITLLNDICYNPANLKFGVICRNTYGSAIFSPIYVTYEINHQYDPHFIELYLTNEDFIGRVLRYEQGTVYERMAVSSDDFLRSIIYLPSRNEQERISKIFSIIEDKLSIEQAILQKYKEQKKFLLSNMFI